MADEELPPDDAPTPSDEGAGNDVAPRHARDARLDRADRDPGGDGAVVPRLRHVGHRVAGAARRARRPQAGAPPDPLGDARGRHAARPAAQEVRHGRGRRAGQVPPPRRPVGVLRAGADGPGLVGSPRAHRQARQLRFARPERPPRRLPLHRGAAVEPRHAPAGEHRRGHRRLRRELRRLDRGADGPAVALPEPPGQRQPGHRGRHGDEHPASQPGRGHRRRGAPHRQPRGDRRGPDALREGARLPHRWSDHGPRRVGRGVPDRPWLRQDPGPRRDRRERQAHADRRVGDPVPDVGRGDRAARRPSWSTPARSMASEPSATSRPRA